MTYSAESFYRGTIRQSITSTVVPPFALKVSKVPTLTTGLLTVSPNTSNEEIFEYTGIDATALTITVTKRGLNPSSQTLNTSGTDYNNTSFMKSHSQNDSIRGDVNHLHIIQDYGTLQANKLDKAAGLRTTMGNARQETEIDTSGNEVKNAITIGATTPSTDLIQSHNPGTRAVTEVPYSSILTDISNTVGNIKFARAGEALTKDDFVTYEIQRGFAFNANTGLTSSSAMGDASARTRESIDIIGNGISASTLKMSLAKVGAPADSITIRIETDTSGNPSGTLANANSTATITGASLTTTLADTTVTFAGAFTLTDGVLYHIVLSRITSVDVANYYIIGGYARNMRGFKTNIYNGTVWGTAGGTIMKYISYTGMYGVLAVKTNATNLDNTNFIGIVISNTLIGGITNIYSYGIQKNITNVLTPNVYYYLSNTPGLISTSPGTNKIIVGISESTSSIQLINNPKITSGVTVVGGGSTTGITGIFEGNGNIMYITMNAGDTTNPGNVTLESSYDGITFNTMTSISTSAVQVSRTISVLGLGYYRFNLGGISKSFSITF